MKNNQLMKRAFRLYARTLLTSVLGAFMYLSIGVIAHALTPENKTLSGAGWFAMNAVALLVQGFLFSTVVYSESWRHGDKDGAQKIFNNKEGSPHFGLKVALVATIPAWISFIVLIAEKLFSFWPQYTMLYRVAHLSLYPIIVWSMGSMWNVPAGDISWGGILCSALPTVITVAMTWLAYNLGYRQISVGQRIMYADKLRRK